MSLGALAVAWNRKPDHFMMQAPPVAKLVKGLGGIRPAARASNLGTDTVYRLLKGQGTLRSLERVAEAAGYRFPKLPPGASCMPAVRRFISALGATPGISYG